MLIQNQIAVTLFFNKIYHMEKYALLARLEAKVGKEDEVAAFLKCFAVSTRRARHCELVWITNGTIYLWNFDTLKLRKVEKHILKVKLQKL
jgi:hypothetical protein